MDSHGLGTFWKLILRLMRFVGNVSALFAVAVSHGFWCLTCHSGPPKATFRYCSWSLFRMVFDVWHFIAARQRFWKLIQLLMRFVGNVSALFLLHEAHFTSDTLCTKRLLHQTGFTPKSFHTRHLLEEMHSTEKVLDETFLPQTPWRGISTKQLSKEILTEKYFRKKSTKQI